MTELRAEFPKELDDLVGEHILDGVDLYAERIDYNWHDGDANIVRFRLDGTVYTAVENPSDGYRSSMRKLFVSDEKMTNTFPPVRVIGRKLVNDDWTENNVLELVDVVTGKVVLAVGTLRSDDYYPRFVGQWSPENMATNAGASVAPAPVNPAWGSF